MNDAYVELKVGDKVMVMDSPAKGVRGTVIEGGRNPKVRWDAAIITVPEGFETVVGPVRLKRLG